MDMLMTININYPNNQRKKVTNLKRNIYRNNIHKCITAIKMKLLVKYYGAYD